ncbi:MAG: ABC transporter permease, partial [Longimicrobiaceae bacterium]
WPAGARERVRGLLFRERAEAEMDEEMRFHLEMEAERLVREAGLDPREARRRAAVAFGGVERYREEVRDARGLAWVSGLSLDFRLGFRLLLKYPGLTLVGGLAMAFAIAVGAGAFEFVRQLVDPALPLDGGDRIVAVRTRDARTGAVHGQTLRDFAAWRETLRSVEELGAFRSLERNLIVPGAPAEPVYLAEISASAFRVARVAPLLGRALADADERPGAPPVAVLGYDVWRTRFGGDPAVVGRQVRLGASHATVVGVMPEGFAFPVAHRLWVPLRPAAYDPEAGEGPPVEVFGRLAPGASLERARAELAALGRRAAADFPATHGHLRPEAVPFAKSVVMIDLPPALHRAMYAANLFFVMLVVLVCANVALLMFARAATREGEIVVRSALGASRSRIVAQLFAEALVLGVAAAATGLAAARLALGWWLDVYRAESQGRLPFWFHDGLSPTTLLYAAALAVLGATIAGVVPALKMTGRGVDARLRQLAAGSGGLRFGRLWTAVIVAQVAVTVAFPATAFFARRYVVGVQSLEVGFPAGEYLSARLEMDGDAPQLPARLPAAAVELRRRLAAEPGVAGAAFTDRLPRTTHPQRWVEVDAGGAAEPDSDRGHTVTGAAVDPDYFGALGAPVHAGRGFHSADLRPDARTVVVNESFVRRVLGGRNPLGRRVRYAVPPGQEPGPWHEIVGVVRDLGMIADDPENGAGLYHAAVPGASSPVYLAVHLRGGPEAFAPRLRALAAATGPTLRLHEVMPLDRAGASMWMELDFVWRLLALVSSVALLLSLAGIYAVTAFTVSRRTREIGIRVALGADARRVVAAIFARPVAQVGLGVLAGGLVTAALAFGLMRGALWPRGAAAVLAYAALMMGVCMLACIVPTRRALRVEPTEALRADG